MKHSLINRTQCVPLVGCKLTIPVVVVNVSSLMYTPAGIMKMSFIFTLEVASFFSPCFSTKSLKIIIHLGKKLLKVFSSLRLYSLFLCIYFFIVKMKNFFTPVLNQWVDCNQKPSKQNTTSLTSHVWNF